MRGLLVAYATAVAALLTVCDWACHVRQGVLVYPEPIAREWLPGQPTPAVFLLFFSCTAIGLGLAWSRLRERAPVGLVATLVSVLAFVACYWGSGRFAAYPLAFSLACIGVWQVQVAASQRRAELIGFSIVLALAGTLVEMVVSSTGFFAYLRPDFLGVPMWLPALYLAGAPAALATLGIIAGGNHSRG